MALTELRNNINSKFKSRCKSAPSQRRRTLDELPMDYSNMETTALAQNWRNRQFKKNETVSKISADSDSLRKYGRQRFDYFLQKAKVDLESHRRISYDTRPFTAYNGPTRYGSPLYNKQPSMLSTIRLRPNSHVGSFQHEAETHPTIKTTLSNSNCLYVVSQSRPLSQFSTTTSSTFSDTSEYIFIPQTKSAQLLERTHNGYLSAENLGIQSCRRSSRPILLDISSTSSSASLSGCKVPVVTETNIETTQEGLNEIPEEHNEKVPVTINPGKKPKQNVRGIRTKRSRPKCWVDDVTVSSEPSVSPKLCGEEELEIAPNQPTEEQIDIHPTLPEPGQSPDVTAGQLDQINIEEHVIQDDNIVNLEDLKEQKLELPAFLCPSSEMKSRHTAIKDWLANTSFCVSRKPIPMF